MNNRRVAKAIRRMNRQVLGEFQGPVRARVTEQSHFANANTINVEVLTADDQPDANWPIIEHVEVPRLLWAGGTTGVFARLNPSAVVRIGFYDGDRHRPYLDAVLGSEESPDISGIEFLVKANGATITVAPGAITSAAGVVTMVAAIVEEITKEVINAASVQVVPTKATISASAVGGATIESKSAGSGDRSVNSESNRDQMRQDLGFDPMPSDSTTWEQYYQIAEWFSNGNASEVKYGTGHQAQQYDSLMCDFSNVLFAYGGACLAYGARAYRLER